MEGWVERMMVQSQAAAGLGWGAIGSSESNLSMDG